MGAKGGRPALFGPKPKTAANRIVGLLTNDGRRAFEACRRKAAELWKSVTGQKFAGDVSDGDTAEYAALVAAGGEEAAREGMRRKAKRDKLIE